MPVGPSLVKNGLAVGLPIDPKNAPGVRVYLHLFTSLG